MLAKHPIPKQITTFEFKLIGFMTLKQFLYLVIFAPLGYIVFFFTPIPYLNIALGVLVALIGVALAFLKIQDRSLEVWIRNFIKSINSPTLYIFKKKGLELDFLQDIIVPTDEKQISMQIESAQYINTYTQSRAKPAPDKAKGRRKLNLSSLFFKKKEEKKAQESAKPAADKTSQLTSQSPAKLASGRKAFLSGIVYSSRKVPLPGVLVYIKDGQGNPVRLMKSNLHGVFATFRPLQPGDYTIEVKDPSSSNSFDTINLKVEENTEITPIEIYARQ